LPYINIAVANIAGQPAHRGTVSASGRATAGSPTTARRQRHAHRHRRRGRERKDGEHPREGRFGVVDDESADPANSIGRNSAAERIDVLGSSMVAAKAPKHASQSAKPSSAYSTDSRSVPARSPPIDGHDALPSATAARRGRAGRRRRS
jgi:hypothetical protein